MKKNYQCVLAALFVLLFSNLSFAENEDPCTKPTTLTKIDEVYQIGSCGDLYKFAEMVSSGEFDDNINGKLTADICVNACGKGESVLNDGTLNGDGSNFKPWTPMNVKSGVQVTLNGAGKTISGLYFNDEKNDYVGLFGEVTGALSISDLGVKDSYFKGRYYVGGLVGCNNGGSLSIENSYNEGTVSGGENSGYVGGLVGYSYNGTLTITNSYNAGTVSGSGDYVGGLVGINDEGTLTITNSYNSGPVSGNLYVGGLVGVNYESVTLTITNSYNAGTVSGSGDYVGGLVGVNYESATLTITNSYNSGPVSGSDSFVGGLVGMNYESATLTITNSYNAGTVSGIITVGGLVGYSYNGTLTITNSYNAGTVSGIGVGGLVGYSSGTLTIAHSFFLATDKIGDEFGGEVKALDDFHNGTVARNLHDWCEKDGDKCKDGGLNGSVWSQNVTKENSLPNFSDSVLSFKRGGVAFFYGEGNDVDSAHVDATSELTVDFPNDVVVSGPVKFKRTFVGDGYSTIMLPFTPNCTDDDCVEGVKFFEFNSYTDGEVQATEVSPSALKANTPYLVSVTGGATELVFKNGGTFNTTTGDAYNPKTGEYKVALTGDGAGWTIYGTYDYKTWEEGDAGLGRTYGFAANDGVNNPAIVGKFTKVGVGAYIYPMRAYLEYVAPAKQSRPAANGAARAGVANTVASLPETINVVIVDKDETGTEIASETSGEQTTRVIGSINTRTGEFKFATDRWFDLNGRYLGVKKPTQKGAYYNNGKKVIVK